VGGPKDVQAPVALLTPEPDIRSLSTRGSFNETVTVALVIDTCGYPIGVHLLGQAREDVARVALDAVEKYRFKPAMQSGKPIAVVLDVKVNLRSF
jgi:hypothetical protein